MPTYPVLVDDWQFECCGRAFAVGDEVRWLIDLIDLEGTLPPPFRTTLSGDVIVAHGIRTLRFGGLTVGLDPQDGQIAVAMTGVLHQEHHGGLPQDFPETTGIVEQIFVVTRPYRMIGDRAWGPVQEAATLREVTRSPDGFRQPRLDAGSPEREHEDGMLVYLAVA